MELNHEFEVTVPLQEAWDVLTDLERIAPCLPGAPLQEVEGEEYRGTVKVKVGPITAQYKGKAHFVQLDRDARKAVLTASGRDTKGQGNASASITAQLSELDGGTHVSLLTDLTLTGKVAQFGRGVLADVSAKLMSQFVENLESTVLGPGSGNGAEPPAEPAAAEPPAEAAAAEPPAEPVAAEPEPEADAVAPATAPSAVRTIHQPEAEPVDLLDAAGSPVLKRLVPVVVVGAVVVAVVWWFRRRRP
jgi:carbon monoxide dehydrogenase subunit G